MPLGDSHHHRRDAGSVRLALITVSDTRDASSDTGGALLRRLCEEAGHEVLDQRIVPDDVEAIRAAVRAAAGLERCRAVLLTGGTGVAERDNTCEAVEGLLHKRIEGFGELFRALSYQEIGSSTVQSRALAGFANDTVIFCMPGSTGCGIS